MRKIIILTAVAIVAVVVVWSVSTSGRPKIAINVNATEASAPILPHEIIGHAKELPVESWDAF